MSEDSELLKKLFKYIQEVNDNQTKEIKNHIDKEIKLLKETIQVETEKRNELETQYNLLKQKYNVLEKSLKKNNIIIFGLQNDTEKNLLDFTIDTLKKGLNVDLIKQDINNIFTIGKQTQNKPIIVKFVSYLKKTEILKAAPKLKGSSISIAEELTPEERNINKILKKHLKQARSKGLSAYIRYNKLFINNEEYTIEQLVDDEAQIECEGTEETKTDENCDTPQQIIKVNSAPPTPIQINKRTFDSGTESEEIMVDALSKKRKVVQPIQQRSSPRLNDTESKKKQGDK